MTSEIVFADLTWILIAFAIPLAVCSVFCVIGLIACLAFVSSESRSRILSRAGGVVGFGLIAVVVCISVMNVRSSHTAGEFAWGPHFTLGETPGVLGPLGGWPGAPSLFHYVVNSFLTLLPIAIAGGLVMLAIGYSRRRQENTARGRWFARPPGAAFASGAVMLLAAIAFSLASPDPTKSTGEVAEPTFVEFLELCFANGSENPSYGDLLQLAAERELTEDEARISEYEAIGKLPYGVPSGPHSSYAETFQFTFGGAGDPPVEGVWGPLIQRDEVFRVDDLDADLNDEFISPTEVDEQIPVSLHEASALSDTAEIQMSGAPSVTLSAIASARFTSVVEAWDDLRQKAKSRVQRMRPEATGSKLDRLATRSMRDGVTRLAISREPLVIADGVDGELVQPMYRVHVAISNEDWSDSIASMKETGRPSRERAIWLVGALAVATLVIGGIGARGSLRASE